MAKYLGGNIPHKNFVIKQQDYDFFLTFSTGPFTKKTISLSDTISSAEIITKENQRKFLSSAGWGFLGFIMSGGLAALATGAVGGKTARIVVACELNNGWRCALEVTQKEYETLVILVPKKQNDTEILTALKQLKELQELGVITAEEFEEKRQNLIKELLPQQNIATTPDVKPDTTPRSNKRSAKFPINLTSDINTTENQQLKKRGSTGCFIIILCILGLLISQNPTPEKNIITPPSTNSNTTVEKNDITTTPTNNTPPKTPKEQLKMPKFKAVDTKIGSNLISIAAYYNDRSKENIILAARCWLRQKDNKNIFVYFVNDPTYSIDRRREETAKVLAFYESVNGGSVLYFLNPDGTSYETLKID